MYSFPGGKPPRGKPSRGNSSSHSSSRGNSSSGNSFSGNPPPGRYPSLDRPPSPLPRRGNRPPNTAPPKGYYYRPEGREPQTDCPPGVRWYNAAPSGDYWYGAFPRPPERPNGDRPDLFLIREDEDTTVYEEVNYGRYKLIRFILYYMESCRNEK